MLPAFDAPVWLRLDALANRAAWQPLLQLERAEFETVLGQPVNLDRPAAHERATHVWDVVVDETSGCAKLEADLHRRRMTLTLPGEEAFGAGINLLHSLAYSPATAVLDSEADTYAEAFDRIHDEVANIYPYFELRGLDWDAITSRYRHVRELVGDDFWDAASQWVAELGDAHTQLIKPGARFHPPYVAAMHGAGALLHHVPQDSAAWAAGVRPGHVVEVPEPSVWLHGVGASPQHRAFVAARRFMAMTTAERQYTARAPDGTRHSWTELRTERPAVVARGNSIRITRFTPEVPALLRRATADADTDKPLTLDLRGNPGGDLVAAAEARRIFVRDDGPFGAVAFTTGRGTLGKPVHLTTAPARDPWRGEVLVLVDAMTYSAAEDFLHPLVGCSHVTILGGPTGGGSGRPHTRRLIDGVTLAVSTAITYTRDGAPIEYRGIRPTATGTGGAVR
ncbi:S41 family peptidase [Cellulomonas sp.]|uniref:S41 family peptidase n=1 Tax=Cellulomonas sp. TaxID=40001 RepID=UPI0028122CFE|nr:S41 family peptidase [Cellulomonas sp.]